MENLDENSKKCLKNLCEILEANKQQKEILSQPFEFNSVQANRDRSLEYPSLGGVTDMSGGMGGGIVGIGGLGSMPSTFSEGMSIGQPMQQLGGSHAGFGPTSFLK